MGMPFASKVRAASSRQLIGSFNRMSASKFIAELERRKFLSDRLMKKLRESLEATRSPLSAEKLGNFLVQKKHLTQSQANDLLASLTQSGVNLMEEDLHDDIAPPGGSSIFTPQITSSRKKADEEEDEIRLAPIEDEVAATKASKKPSDIEDDDLPRSAWIRKKNRSRGRDGSPRSPLLTSPI